jgi:hypothetical protein
MGMGGNAAVGEVLAQSLAILAAGHGDMKL